MSHSAKLIVVAAELDAVLWTSECKAARTSLAGQTKTGPPS